MAKKQWNWNKFYGGLSDYPTIITDSDSTKYGNESFSVDGRKEPNGVQTGQYFTSGDYIVSGDITAYIDLREFFNLGTTVPESIVAVTKTGNVYQNGTLIYTFTTPNVKEIYAMTVMNVSGTKYLYFFSPYGISKCSINTSTLVISTFIENHIPFTNTWFTETKIYNANDKIFFCSGNYINSIDDAETLTNGEIILPEEYLITGITYWQDTYRIYGKSKTNGIVYVWNGIKSSSWSTAPTYSVVYNGLPVIWVTGESGLDYAIMGYSSDYSDLYALQWSSAPQMLISNSEGSLWDRKFNGQIAIRAWIIYLWGELNGNKCLFSYGNYHKGYPQSLQVEWRTGNITAIYPRSANTLFWCNVWGGTPTRSGKQEIWVWNHESVGDVSSLIFTWGKRTLKSIIECEICFDNDNANPYYKHGGQVTLYARKRQSATWTVVRVFQTDYTNAPDGFVIIGRNEFWEMGNFNQIELKLRLESVYDGVTYKTSPLVTSVTLTYDDNIKWS